MSFFAILAAVRDTLDRNPEYIFVLTSSEDGQSVKIAVFHEQLVFNMESNIPEIITEMTKESDVKIQ